MDIEQLEQYVVLRCIPDYDYSFFMRSMVVFQYMPFYLRIGMYAITLTFKCQEIYYKFFSFGLTLDWAINFLLRHAIGSSPHIKNCGADYSMPSSHAQHVFFFYTMVVTYLIIQKKNLGVINLTLLTSVPALVCASRLVLGFNTFPELMAGNIIGVSFGFAYQYFLFRWVKPRIHYLLEIRVLRWLGFRDHFFYVSGDPESDEEGEKAREIDLSTESIVNITRKKRAVSLDQCVFCQLGFYHETHF